MKTVPLHGKKAAGRVARVNDEDYDLVMQYRWRVHDPDPRPGRRRNGPYAVTSVGRSGVLRMHCLIMGVNGVDHRDHDGLNNQRSNLRIATQAQNNKNHRPRVTGGNSSKYKGVFRAERGLWRACISADGRRRNIGRFASELEAAYAYDEAARELHGEFACPNFPEGPTQAMRDQWQAEREARSAAVAASGVRKRTRAVSEWWAQREPEIGICAECGGEFQHRAAAGATYCQRQECVRKRKARSARERRLAARESREAVALLPVTSRQRVKHEH